MSATALDKAYGLLVVFGVLLTYTVWAAVLNYNVIIVALFAGLAGQTFGWAAKYIILASRGK